MRRGKGLVLQRVSDVKQSCVENLGKHFVEGIDGVFVSGRVIGVKRSEFDQGNGCLDFELVNWALLHLNHFSPVVGKGKWSLDGGTEGLEQNHSPDLEGLGVLVVLETHKQGAVEDFDQDQENLQGVQKALLETF